MKSEELGGWEAKELKVKTPRAKLREASRIGNVLLKAPNQRGMTMWEIGIHAPGGFCASYFTRCW